MGVFIQVKEMRSIFYMIPIVVALFSTIGCHPRIETADTTQSFIIYEPIEDLTTLPQDGFNPEIIYASHEDEEFILPAIPWEKIDFKFLRQEVNYVSPEKPGSIIIHLNERFLYLVQPKGKAIRYGIGVGREGFRWSGKANIQFGREWPVWTPPQPMILRTPSLKQWAKGYPPGITNPLGARALYLYKNNKDTEYRIHGSPEWWSIGKAVSSGCIRMINQDVIDLYSRVKNGAIVEVKQ